MFRYLFSPIVRHVRSTAKSYSSSNSPLAIEFLKSRSVLKVSGQDTTQFMQGLITNDMKHLEEGACSMYTMFLNTKGRVMYDAIVYRTPETETYLIECDAAALPPLKKHLSLYRVRRKIAIDSLEDSTNVWVVYDPRVADIQNSGYPEITAIPGVIVPCTTLEETNNPTVNLPFDQPEFQKDHNLTICRDPRVPALGFRILASKELAMERIASEEIGAVPSSPETQHKVLRYKLGVGEGVGDLPPGNCFPLEANCDYLHGVSFHKGCYIGQELTARTHHTGVVRKRLMPIEFDSMPASEATPDAPIQLGNSCSRPVGKLRGSEGKIGLALLRIAEALDAPAMKVLDVTCQTSKPFWWPQEAPRAKDRMAIGKDISN